MLFRGQRASRTRVLCQIANYLQHSMVFTKPCTGSVNGCRGPFPATEDLSTATQEFALFAIKGASAATLTNHRH